MRFEITEPAIGDHEELLHLWQNAEGVGLTQADSREGVEAYLNRNPGLSLVARQAGRLVGAILCGHDGRRGYLHHLAVAPDARRQGIGTALVEEALSGLARIGIQKCHAWVYQQNEEAQRFWQRVGWTARTDLIVMSRELA